ncbi:SAUR family protein [Marchantia polymorpha subsp. ruderalis]|uniref:Uncharacterized protein n=2 Tax=Marchantia polymorpha TaxID=3197 RepID=A0AAF6AV28_MARPO|nr:hypothetical protein MARPO_0002s0081 [Marchantia polymorpha]BBN00299.1 hypothetical protein Mp_1g27970 [Marchantia polymorpha subsp. ruderalis]|eukprot:PTQ49584.1 hypothetical protein MARPO_0002s0081 [Marchantia polymorpha]
MSRHGCSSPDASPCTTSSGYESTFSLSESNTGSWDSSSDSANSPARSSADSTASWLGPLKSTSSIFHLKRAPWIPQKRSACKHTKSTTGDRKPVILEKAPFGKSSKYLTVYVGPRIEQSVKYVISRSLLVHPLFQVLLKCSEDEFGEDYAVKKGVAIVCDPALFLQVVRAVDDSLWSAQTSKAQELDVSIDAST